MVIMGELLEKFNLNLKFVDKALNLSFKGDYNTCQIDCSNDGTKYFFFQDELDEERYISISFSTLGITIYFTEGNESFIYDEYGESVVMR